MKKKIKRTNISQLSKIEINEEIPIQSPKNQSNKN